MSQHFVSEITLQPDWYETHRVEGKMHIGCPNLDPGRDSKAYVVRKMTNVTDLILISKLNG